MLKPKLRIGLFLLVVNAAWVVACYLWCDRETWLWATPIALSINSLLLTYDQVLRFRSFEGRALIGADPWGLLKIVHQLCEELKIASPPQVFIIESPCAQIFAYARAARHTRLFITAGALELLTARQLRAVLTFQLIGIRDNYGVLNYWIAAVLDMFFRIGMTLQRAFAFVFGWSPALAAWFLSPWMWLMRVTLLGARDFERLDRLTAAHLDNPEDLAQALWRLEAYAQTKPWPEPWILAHMCMVSPLNAQSALRFVQVQPLVKSRIKKIVGRYPL